MKRRTFISLMSVMAAAGVLTLAGCSSNSGSSAAASGAASSAASTGAADQLAAIQANGKLVVALEGAWQPWSYHDESDTLVGYDVEVSRAIAKKLGVEPEYVESDWDSLFAGLDAGRFDIVCNGVEVTDERAKTYDFTTPYGYIHTALAVRKDNEDIKSFEDLKGKTTANSLASTYMELAESYGATVQGIDTLEETIQLLADSDVSNVEDLTEAAKNHVFDYTFVDNENLGSITRLEGFLFPDTYEFFHKEDAVSALDRLLSNFQTRVSGDLLTDIENSQYSLREIVTLASIIEKEAIGDDEERANISSVFYNRLSGDNSEIGTALQSDATIYYALHIAGMDDTQFSTDLDSPYNTYKYGGLPAGPICNPSLSSIKAAVHPNDTGYYYFAYGKDGVSHFFRTYDEHLAFVNSDMYAPD